MFIGFDRKKEITVLTTRAPSRKIRVQAYPVLLHTDFPLKLTVYRDPCYPGRWTCCETTTGIHIGLSFPTRRDTIMQAIEKINAYIEEHHGNTNSVIELIEKNEVLNEHQG